MPVAWRRSCAPALWASLAWGRSVRRSRRVAVVEYPLGVCVGGYRLCGSARGGTSLPFNWLRRTALVVARIAAQVSRGGYPFYAEH